MAKSEQLPLECYGIDAPSDGVCRIPVFTKRDKKIARQSMAYEIVSDINLKSIFVLGIDCILSIQDLRTKQHVMSKGIEDADLTSPWKINGNKELLGKLMKTASLAPSKKDYIQSFCKYWEESDIGERILNDIKNGRKKGTELKEELIKKVRGFGKKIGSYYFMRLGYDDEIAIDIHLQKFIVKYGYLLRRETKHLERNGGLTGRKYEEAKEIFVDLADYFGYDDVNFFKYLVWNKRAKGAGDFIRHMEQGRIHEFLGDQSTFDRFS